MDEPHEPMPPTVPPPPPTDPPTRAVTADRDVAGPAAPPDEVPDLDDRPRTLDRRIVTVWRVSTALVVAVPLVVAGASAIAVFGVRGAVVPVVLLAAAIVLVIRYPLARYARWRWRLSDIAVELERGVVVRRTEAVPYFRIQQIDVTRGPIDRLLGLASLQVTSASASGSVSLPGLAADEAPGVRRALLARAAEAVGSRDLGVRDAV